MHSSPALPDPFVCKTRHSDADYWACLVKRHNPFVSCTFATEIDGVFICNHADRKKFEHVKG